MKAGKKGKPLAPDTVCIHGGGRPDEPSAPLTMPMYLTSSFRVPDSGEHGRYYYTRYGNPTRTALESTLAALEGGAGSVALSAGVAAELTVMHLFGAGTHVVADAGIYGGTHRLFVQHMSRMGFTFSFVDTRDAANVERALTPATRLVWIESPTNPLLNLADIAAVARVARRHGVTTAVDNTFASPVFQRPLDLGADVVMHSTTKYLNGHSDVVGGAVIAKSPETVARLAEIAGSLGTTGSPFDAYMVLRGLKTLVVRMQAHARNATALAGFLETHPAVERVYYPGLESHPQHELARRQMKGFGGMVSCDLRGGQAAVFDVFRRLRIFTSATSLGGVESLVQHPTTMSHASLTPEERAAAGIKDGCLRISVGIENPDDLVADMRQALTVL